MVQSGKTPQEFIQYSFSPMVAVLSTPTVDSIVSKNNLSFVELLQPFCQLQSEGHVRDPSGTQCTVRNWRLIVSDVHSKPPQPTVARKLLNDAVSLQACYQTVNLQSGNYKIDIPSSTPWFDKWRETYFNVQFPSDHEFTKHYVSCMLVGSTSDTNLAESFSSLIQQLTQLQNVAPPKLPKWFNTNILRCYVLLHDVSGSITTEKGERLFESLKQAYGAGNCFFLSINSKTGSSGLNDPPLPDLWSQYILSRSESNPELGSSRNSLPHTPVDARAISSLPSTLSTGSADDPTTSPSVVTPPEGSPHPLSPAGDPTSGSFDGATNLQNDLSGSAESVTGFINANVWDTTLANSPMGVVYGTAMTLQDTENVKTFMNDFAFKALLPYFERQISQLHDAVANKKGVSRSLLSATKRWFGTNKPGTTTNVNTVIYTADCSELQLRKMGDMWFMLGQWNNAFQAYHTAKREFNVDNAWLCYAGALEMAALSAFMSNESTRKTYDYMEESIMTYFVSCRMVQYAVRATLLSVLCLNSKGLHGEAAKQLIRMTSEDSDLRSAVLLEQAALCFLAGPPRRTMPRKYGFHMVLAGHRFTKAGQKKHALRCYKQSFQIYGHSGWRLAQDHVQFATGRLAGQLGATEEAAAALAAPLASGSPQPPAQQAQLLREYMLAHQKWTDSSPEYRTALPLLPLPLLMSNETVVLCGGIAPLSAPGRVAASGTTLQQADDTVGSDTNYWPKLEEMLVQTAKGTAPMIFRPTTSLYNNTTDNTSKPIVPQGEPVQVLVQLQNPLKIPVTLVDLQLLWNFECNDDDGTGQVISNEYYLASSTEMVNLAVATQTISNTVIHGNATSSVHLSITPLKSGELTLLGVAFKLCNAVEGSSEPGTGLVIVGKQMFNIRGPKLKNSKDASKEYGLDQRLQITVTPPAPCLQVTFSEITTDLLCGELQRIDVELRNVGPVHMKSLYVAMSHPQYVSFDTENNNFSMLREEMYDTPTTLQDERQMRNYREQHWRRLHVRSVLEELSAGRKHSTQLWLRAPHCVQHEPHMLHLLFYYESVNSDPVPKYRLMRHTMTIKVQESVKIMAIPRHSLKFNEDRSSCQEVISLSVDVKNANNTEDNGYMQIQVLNTSFLSRQWVLRGFVPLAESNKLLNGREKMHLILRGERCLNIENVSPINITSSDLRISENDPISSMGVGEVPYASFVTEFSSPFKTNNFELSNAENSSGKNVSVHSTLVVRWKALVSLEKGNTRTVIGQHYLWLDNFQRKICSQPEVKLSQNADVSVLKLFGCDDSTLLSSVGVTKASPQEGENYVAYKLEHSREVNHDFYCRKICMVPVKVHLVNCIGQAVVAYVDMSHLSNNIGWVGVVSGHSEGVKVVLDPYQSSSISVNAICTSPGTYLLGNTFQISCQIDVSDGSTSSPMKQSCVATSLLVVNQT